MKYLAFHILCSADHWFRDGGELQVVLQENSVWKKLGIFSRGTGTTGTWSKSPAVHMYIKLGDKICDLPPWNSIIGQDLPGWLGCLSSLRGRQEDDTKFQSVLSRVWQENQQEANKFKNEQRFAMSFNALAHVWDRCDFSNHEIISCLFSLVQCTVSTVLCTKIIPITGSNKLGKPSKSFKDIIVAHLENSLSQAIQKMKISTNLIPDDQSLTGILHGSSEVLSELVLLINEELRDSDPSGYGWDDQTEQQYWRDLEARFNTDLEVLKDVFTAVKTSSGKNTPLEANTPPTPQAPPPRS
ncbi:hypothetical protein C8R43DRAFT_1036545 [Mycena crocata]|nr:hypothetical protein C8R43DRAFT_1036545 [Mycena crocata]